MRCPMREGFGGRRFQRGKMEGARGDDVRERVSANAANAGLCWRVDRLGSAIEACEGIPGALKPNLHVSADATTLCNECKYICSILSGCGAGYAEAVSLHRSPSPSFVIVDQQTQKVLEVYTLCTSTDGPTATRKPSPTARGTTQACS